MSTTISVDGEGFALDWLLHHPVLHFSHMSENKRINRNARVCTRFALTGAGSLEGAWAPIACWKNVRDSIERTPRHKSTSPSLVTVGDVEAMATAINAALDAIYDAERLRPAPQSSRLAALPSAALPSAT